MLHAHEFHDNLAFELLNAINKELKVEPEDLLDVVKRLLNLDELRRKEERIGNLEKERDNLQSQLNWVEGELVASKQREKEALQLVKNLSGLVDRPLELIIKASLVQDRLIKEGHLTRSKV